MSAVCVYSISHKHLRVEKYVDAVEKVLFTLLQFFFLLQFLNNT